MVPVVFLHGWSGSINTYSKLPRLLKSKYNVIELFLGEYTTGDDDLSIDDYAIALEKAVIDKGIQKPFDVVIHSTGALVVRAWLSRFHKAGNPSSVRKFIMAAPANNGSRLAGWGKKLPWDWGNKVLNALELASSYTWNLNWAWMGNDYQALKNNGLEMYHLQGTNNDIDMPGFLDNIDNFLGIDIPVFEEEGSDNTVRFCAANLNMKGVRIGLGQTLEGALPREISNIPIYVFENRSHFGKKHGILGAIRDDNDPVFKAIDAILRDAPPPATAEKDYPSGINYTMLNIRVIDQLGNPHEDFIVRFYLDSKDVNDAIKVEHRYENRETDCYYLKYKDLGSTKRFGFRIEGNKIRNANYAPSKNIDLYCPDEGVDFFSARKTHLVEVMIEKSLSEKAFSFKKM